MGGNGDFSLAGVWEISLGKGHYRETYRCTLERSGDAAATSEFQVAGWLYWYIIMTEIINKSI